MTGLFQNNLSDSRFEYHTHGSFAFATYRISDGILYIDYVEAPEALRGTGAASKLMESVLDYARQNGLNIQPICGYAAAWLKRHAD